MIPIETLELRMDSVIRTGLRRSMAYIDVNDPSDPLREVKASLESAVYTALRNQIVATYAEGYIHGGHLIRKHAPSNMMLSAATTPTLDYTREDPRMAKATKAVIYSLEGSIVAHRNEIQAIIRTQFERGATVPMIARRLGGYFDNNRVAATRFARTLTNDIYSRAALDRYEDSGIVDGVKYSAHIDKRTSNTCRMLNSTIWGLDDPDIKVPPSHFNCRSALNPYWGKIPGKRDYVAEFGSKFVDGANKSMDVFRKSYWTAMPHTKASATLQRLYFDKRDLIALRDGLNLLGAAQKTRALPDLVPLKLLKDRIRYRKIDPDTSMIIDTFGKGIMLDKFERNKLNDAIHANIAAAQARHDRLIKKGLDTLADGESAKIAGYEEILSRMV